MKSFFIKITILLFPLIIIVGYFIIIDPMKIIYDYKSPVEKGVLINDRLFQYNYLSKNINKYHSFIFGSSRSKAFKTYNLKRIAGIDSVFHMGVNDETLWGLYKKLSFIRDQKIRLKHVIIILDHRILSLTNDHAAHIFKEHYKVSGESIGEYYKSFLISFLKPDFLKSYIKWCLYKKYDSSMKNYIFKEDFFYKKEGDIDYIGYEDEIKKDSIGYYKKNEHLFYPRKPEFLNSIITNKGNKLLKEIALLLNQNNVDYKVIVTPNYDLKILNSADIQIIKNLFGEKNIYNFSGVNEYTSIIGNYYEEKHFKPYVANKITSAIFNNK